MLPSTGLSGSNNSESSRNPQGKRNWLANHKRINITLKTVWNNCIKTLKTLKPYELISKPYALKPMFLCFYNTNITLKTVKKLWENLNYVLQQLPYEFCPKEPLNRSRNPITNLILVWRKSQVFRLHLTDIFGPFNFRIRTYGKLQSCSLLSYIYSPTLIISIGYLSQKLCSKY